MTNEHEAMRNASRYYYEEVMNHHIEQMGTNLERLRGIENLYGTTTSELAAKRLVVHHNRIKRAIRRSAQKIEEAGMHHQDDYPEDVCVKDYPDSEIL